MVPYICAAHRGICGLCMGTMGTVPIISILYIFVVGFFFFHIYFAYIQLSCLTWRWLTLWNPTFCVQHHRLIQMGNRTLFKENCKYRSCKYRVDREAVREWIWVSNNLWISLPISAFILLILFSFDKKLESKKSQ